MADTLIKICRTFEEISAALSRSQLGYEEINSAVREIVRSVKTRGDAALSEYTRKFDGIDLKAENSEVTQKEIDDAEKQVSKGLKAALKNAARNIKIYQSKLMRGIAANAAKSFDKKTGVGYIVRPVSRAGIYVPGGKAPYPSSVLMCAVTAKAAGVKEIVMCTPAGRGVHPLILTAARFCGVDRVFKIGGAQAVAAMAYSTATVPKCDVIVGPGNIYVTLAKKEIYGEAGIDMLAGPSEILIIADETADPRFLAADMLSQAEHDELASAFLVTTSEALAEKVVSELEFALDKLPRKGIAKKAIRNNSAVIIAGSLEKAFEISNKIAPEHLELCIKEPEKQLASVLNAGAVFLGNYTPEPVGDYYAGSNHVLPTSGAARYASGLSVENFIKKISVDNYSREMLLKAKDDIIALAETEEFHAHANAVKVRFDR